MATWTTSGTHDNSEWTGLWLCGEELETRAQLCLHLKQHVMPWHLSHLIWFPRGAGCFAQAIQSTQTTQDEGAAQPQQKHGVHLSAHPHGVETRVLVHRSSTLSGLRIYGRAGAPWRTRSLRRPPPPSPGGPRVISRSAKRCGNMGARPERILRGGELPLQDRGPDSLEPVVVFLH